MWPLLFEVGGIEVRTYGVLGAIGFLVGAFLGLRQADRHGWSRDRVIDVIFWSSLAGLLGARLLFLAQNPDQLVGVGALLSPRGAGFVFYGAPLLGIPVAILLVRRFGLPLAQVLDGFGLCAPVAHGISRIGCFAAGCCHGRPSELPWAVTFHDPLAAAPLDIALHPTQLYEAAGLFLLSAGLWWRAPRARPGESFLGWIGGYAALRFVVEVFRGDAERGFVGPLSTSQALALVALVGVGVVLTVRRRGAATTP